MADVPAALGNLERAFAELESYVALPVRNQRDKAGLIQGFEFTFELFWKTFQKLAPEAGLDASSPREALIAGVKLHVITAEESPHWSQMLRDRNQPYLQRGRGRPDHRATAAGLHAGVPCHAGATARAGLTLTSSPAT